MEARAAQRSWGRRVVFGLGGALLALSAYLFLWPTPIDPRSFEPEEAPALEGALAPNERLREAERIAEGALSGPEDVAVRKDGDLFAGTEDGRVVRIDPDSEKVETFAVTGGRPLGMMFDKSGQLIVCDAFEGLLSIDESGTIEVLVEEAGGTPLGFTNELDIAEDGTIYFSDASSKFDQSEYLYDLLESRPHGRLLRYDPESGGVEVLLGDLYFANGVALSEDERFVLVNETYRYRIRRLWLRGERAGEWEIVADNLPGFPDNLNRSSRGSFWLALYTVRNPLMDRLHPSALAKDVIARLPKFLWPSPEPYGFVAEIDGEGGVVRTLQDPGGEVLTNITSVKEKGGSLYLGSLTSGWIGRLDL